MSRAAEASRYRPGERRRRGGISAADPTYEKATMGGELTVQSGTSRWRLTALALDVAEAGNHRRRQGMYARR